MVFFATYDNNISVCDLSELLLQESTFEESNLGKVMLLKELFCNKALLGKVESSNSTYLGIVIKKAILFNVGFNSKSSVLYHSVEGVSNEK